MIFLNYILEAFGDSILNFNVGGKEGIIATNIRIIYNGIKIDASIIYQFDKKEKV